MRRPQFNNGFSNFHFSPDQFRTHSDAARRREKLERDRAVRTKRGSGTTTATLSSNAFRK